MQHADKLIILMLVAFTLLYIYPQSASAGQPYSIEISTLPAGFSTYTMGVALADLINKNSTWLKAIAVEGRGAAENMKLLVRKPDKRKNTVFFNVPWELWGAKNGATAFKGFDFDYDEFKFIHFSGMAVDVLMTLDPEIKDLHDLTGKKVCFDTAPGKSRHVVYNGILEQIGVDLTKLHQQYGSGKITADRLRDGLVEVGYGAGLVTKLPNIQKLSPFSAQLVATKDTYFISFPEAAVNAFKQKTGHPLVYVKIPPKMYSPLQTKELGGLGKSLGFCAHQSLPDEVVTEILRIVYQNAHKFISYTPLAAVITQKTLASMGIPESGYHPAAVRFFKQNDIPVTSLK